MIRLLLAVMMYLLSQVAFSQTKFEQGMQQAFQLMQENKYDEACNMFERIGNAEPDNWLPYYNLALLKARTTFSMKDKSNVEAQIKIAEDFADKADAISPDNSEIYVLKAMINVAKVASNPMVYGASLSGPTVELYQKAIALDSTNPRAHSGLAKFEMGGARFFKQDLTPYCKRLQESIALYETFKPESGYHPNWGKEWTLQVVKNCGGSAETVSEDVSITVTVPNVSSDEGEVLVALYNSAEDFAARKPIDSQKTTSNDGKATIVFKNVAPGNYAIVCLHDKNKNGRMDFEPTGMPKEDYGSSNNVFRMGPPNFEDAKFIVENKSLDLTIRF